MPVDDPNDGPTTSIASGGDEPGAPDLPTAQLVDTLWISHDQLEYGTRAKQRSIFLRNTETTELEYLASANVNWISLTHAHGTTAGEYRAIRAQVDRTGLAAGSYVGHITITTDAQTIPIVVFVDVAADGTADPNEPLLDVGADELVFSTDANVQTFFVRNGGGGTLDYVITSDVLWAATNPRDGSSSGEHDSITVTVNPAAVPSGLQFGNLVVRSGTQAHYVTLWYGVVSDSLIPNLAVNGDADSLSFGTSASTRTFSLANVGGGTLSYAINADAGWIDFEPAGGHLASGNQTIAVTLNRPRMLIGSHEATVIILADTGQSAVLPVTAEKTIPTPKIIPWIESTGVADADHVIEGLRLWQRVTDTAIVSVYPDCPATCSDLYGILNDRIPEVQIIPGLKTSIILGQDNLDWIEGWQQIGAELTQIAATTGSNIVLLENEEAVRDHGDGLYDINYAQFRQCMTALPDDLTYIWYPAMMYNCVDYKRNRYELLCQVVEEEVDVRFTEVNFGHPNWVDANCKADARYWLEDLAELQPIQVAWFCCIEGFCYWPDDQIDTVLDHVAGAGYSELIVFPRRERWVEGAEGITLHVDQRP